MLTKYEKIEIAFLGTMAPAFISIWALYLLYQGKSVFIGRHQLVYFYGNQSYFVGCLWFGMALGLISHFFLKHALPSRKKYIVSAVNWLAFIIGIVGLSASIWFTFNA